MPRVPIDYAKTIIYKLVHKDDINDDNIYTGHTTDFICRKNGHKTCCTNPNSEKYNQKKYLYIRENGGWDEWLMIEIEKYPCKDVYEAVARERVIQAEMKAKLNTNIAGRTQKEYNKQYQQDNREKRLEQMKQYYKDNHEKRLEYKKQYHQDNREKMLEKITCECGCISTKSHLSRHRKTDKHKKKMEALAN